MGTRSVTAEIPPGPFAPIALAAEPVPGRSFTDPWR